jgi:hypothetical protein
VSVENPTGVQWQKNVWRHNISQRKLYLRTGQEVIPNLSSIMIEATAICFSLLLAFCIEIACIMGGFLFIAIVAILPRVIDICFALKSSGTSNGPLTNGTRKWQAATQPIQERRHHNGAVLAG